jgi:hypothetical protein
LRTAEMAIRRLNRIGAQTISVRQPWHDVLGDCLFYWTHFPCECGSLPPDSFRAAPWVHLITLHRPFIPRCDPANRMYDWSPAPLASSSGSGLAHGLPFTQEPARVEPRRLAMSRASDQSANRSEGFGDISRSSFLVRAWRRLLSRSADPRQSAIHPITVPWRASIG